MSATRTHPGELMQLVDNLDRHGVTYPPRVGQAISMHRLLAGPGLRQQPDGDPFTLTESELTDHVRQRALISALSDQIAGHADQVDGTVIADAARTLSGHAEQILDQLRPAFDTAAGHVHQAVKAGIRPGLRAEQAIDLGEPAIKAWRDLPAQVAVIEPIAGIRTAMTRLLGIPPRPHWDTDTDWSLCFTDTAQPYDIHNEPSQDRWLRLSTTGPVRLLTLDQTQRLTDQATPDPTPLVAQVDEDDGTVRLEQVRALR